MEELTNQYSKPTLLLIHGFGGSARLWDPLIRSLRFPGKIVTFDFPGHGRSNNTPIAHPSKMIDALQTIVDKESKKTTDFYAIGHSLGGLILQHVFLKTPESFKRLGFISSDCRIMIHPEVMDQVIARKYNHSFFVEGFPNGTPKAIIHLVMDEFRKLKSTMSDEAISELSADQSFDEDFSRKIKKYIKNTLVVTGKRDRIISPRRTRNFAKKIPRSYFFEFEGVGHYPFLESTQLFSELIGRFISKDGLVSGQWETVSMMKAMQTAM